MAKKCNPPPVQKCELKSCGKIFTGGRIRKFCSSACRDKQTAINKRERKYATYKSWRREGSATIEQPKPKPRVKLTDEMQHKINLAVDKKYAVKCDGRKITGAEFSELASMYQHQELRGRLRAYYYFNNRT